MKQENTGPGVVPEVLNSEELMKHEAVNIANTSAGKRRVGCVGSAGMAFVGLMASVCVSVGVFNKASRVEYDSSVSVDTGKESREDDALACHPVGSILPIFDPKLFDAGEPLAPFDKLRIQFLGNLFRDGLGENEYKGWAIATTSLMTDPSIDVSNRKRVLFKGETPGNSLSMSQFINRCTNFISANVAIYPDSEEAVAKIDAAGKALLSETAKLMSNRAVAAEPESPESLEKLMSEAWRDYYNLGLTPEDNDSVSHILSIFRNNRKLQGQFFDN